MKFENKNGVFLPQQKSEYKQEIIWETFTYECKDKDIIRFLQLMNEQDAVLVGIVLLDRTQYTKGYDKYIIIYENDIELEIEVTT